MAKAEPDAARVVPHDLGAEESLLGAMLLSRDAVAAAAEACSAADFYRPVHGQAFDAARGLWLAGEPVDAVTVNYELENAGAGGFPGGVGGLLSLASNTPATSNAGQYAAMVRDLATLRRLIGAAGEIADIGYSRPDDAAAAVDQAEALLYEVKGASARAGGSTGLREALAGWLDEFDADAEGTDPGLPAGLAALDDKLVGMRPGELIVVGARPSVGKTMWAVNVVRHAARVRPGEVALYVSAEMTTPDLSERFAAQDARVDLGHLRRRQLHEAEWMRISSAMARLADAPIVIHDDPAVTLTSVRGAARRAARRGRLSLVVVDYLQLMSPEGGRRGENRQVDVAELSRGLKVMARELECPVVALSQLSRAVEARAEKHPILADLRESGSIENDADVVLLLYRDEVYDPHSDKRGTMEVNVAKQRNGPTGVVTVLCDAKTGRLWDVPAEDAAEPLSMNLN